MNVLYKLNSFWNHYIWGLAEKHIGLPRNRSKLINSRLSLEIPLARTEKTSIAFLGYCKTK